MHNATGLTVGDYFRMLLTWLMMAVDTVIRAVLYIVPQPVRSVMDWWRYQITYLVFPIRIFAGYNDETLHPAARLSNITDLCAHWGFGVEEYVAPTPDGYYLGIHRIVAPTVEDDGENSVVDRPVVLLWHGFMMNSEVWVCHPGGHQHNLALVLASQGYDVWLGNCRGNKYSHKHRHLRPRHAQFWDFSLDEHALVDLPTTVDFVLKQTRKKSLSYVGFSQGTTICFAALSLMPELREKLNLFVALAPSTKPHGLSNSLISSAVKATPGLLFLIFGRRSLFPSVLFYQRVLSPRFLVYFIDMAVKILFAWSGKNMSAETKNVTYQHLYSLCSVKLMVHWFQIIRQGRFQMFDDEIDGASASFYAPSQTAIGRPVAPYSVEAVVLSDIVKPRHTRAKSTTGSSSIIQLSTVRSHVSQRFPTEQLRRHDTPIAIFYGGSDTLLDMKALLAGLRFPCDAIASWLRHPTEQALCDDEMAADLADDFPSARTLYDRRDKTKSAGNQSPVVMLKCVAKYEHLCFLWGDHLPQHVYPDILGLLKSYGS